MELTRRTFLHGAVLTVLGAVLGGCGDSASQDPQDRPSPASPPAGGDVRPSLSLSLTVLQEEVQTAGRPLSEKLATLGGMNRIRGFLAEPDGELLLLGDRDGTLPLIELDDLVVALRNAYQISPAYRGAPGCTIDPWSGSKDPWRIQEVKVFGMPPTSPMAARHVALDFELKKVQAGILSLGNEVPSLWDLNRSATALCEGRADKEKNVETTHRFWFTSLYPSSPRFMEEQGMALILKAVEVQLLTEKEFLNKEGKRTGATQASPAAQDFAKLVTQLLATNRVQRYVRLRNDFRVIELAALMGFKGVSPRSLRYLLRDYPLREVTIPAFVGGIRREERGEVVCDTKIAERQISNGRFLESKEEIKRYQFRSRGGVEARIELKPDHFVQESFGALADLRRKVHASRPSANALQWTINY